MTALPLPYSALSNRAALLLKLYAIAFMVVDHVDQVLWQGGAGLHATVGRTVFPVFAFLLAYNLARIRTTDQLLRSLAPRLVLFGLLATPAYAACFGWTAGLNVMFTLALATLVVGLLRDGQRLVPLGLFVVGGAFVDYAWPGVAAIVLGSAALRYDRVLFGFWLPILIPLALWPINGNLWALAAAPLIWTAFSVPGDAPRWKWAFYVAYPAHLAVIALAKFAG
jgi:hypothetical protein